MENGVGKASTRAKNKYRDKTYDRVEVTLPKGRKAEFSNHAIQRGESLNAFIGRAMVETMERDTSQKFLESPVRAANPLEGIITPTTFKAAQRAVESTGEDIPAFVTRAVDVQIKRDKIAFDMGVNPATGERITKGGEQK